MTLKVLSVSRVMSPFFDAGAIRPDMLQAAADRGTAVHAACEAYVKGLPHLSMMESVNGYFTSFRDWFRAYVKRVHYAEDGFRDLETYFIVGHPDLVCELTDGRLVVVDYKTPVIEARSWRAQLAAYCHLVERVMGRKPAGMALMLDRVGRPARAKTYNPGAEDFAGFLAALQAYRWFKEER